MDATRFDYWTRSLTDASPRRNLLRGFAGAALGLTTARLSGVVQAKKKRKQSKKPKLNAFGCLDVGKACAGSDGLCCSGLCEGEKPKKGKQDTSRCIAHGAGSCQAEQDACTLPEVKTPCGTAGFCWRTTGNASFCGDPEETYCVDCKKDQDCEATYGPGAACVVCSAFHCGEIATACATAGA